MLWLTINLAVFSIPRHEFFVVGFRRIWSCFGLLLFGSLFQTKGNYNNSNKSGCPKVNIFAKSFKISTSGKKVSVNFNPWPRFSSKIILPSVCQLSLKEIFYNLFKGLSWIGRKSLSIVAEIWNGEKKLELSVVLCFKEFTTSREKLWSEKKGQNVGANFSDDSTCRRSGTTKEIQNS